MYARVVEVTTKPEKRDQLLKLVHTELQNTLRSQPGFVDMIGLVSDSDPNLGVGIALWQTKEQANRFYTSPAFLNWQEKSSPYLAGEPKTTTFKVDTSTVHKIVEGRAA